MGAIPNAVVTAAHQTFVKWTVNAFGSVGDRRIPVIERLFPAA